MTGIFPRENFGTMPLSFRLISFITIVGAASAAGAQAAPADILAKIKEEGLNHSQIAPTLSYLTDVIGQRLTGSPSMKRANEWTKDKLASWGFSNAHLEGWSFGRGWQLDRFDLEIVSPYDVPLIAYPKAWSPSLGRPVTADVVLVDVTDVADLEKLKGKLKGKIVLNGGERPIEARYTAQGKRYTDQELTDMTAPQAPRGPRGGVPGGGPRPANGARSPMQLAGVKLRFFMQEGALAVIDGSRGDDGTVFVQSASVPPSLETAATGTSAPTRPTSVWDKSAPKTIPQVTVSSEQYNRMVRMVQQGQPLKLHLELKTSFYDKDLNSYNTVAEIPGSDLKDQVVMLGGHMDSWHAGTGATDNGVGVVVAMEAARILKALNLQPRRTVRVALWSGEEEGLFGSRAYVAAHLGTFPPAAPGATRGAPQGPLTKLAEWDKVSAYYNLDNGSGKIRGIFLQGNEAVGPIFSEWLAPFKEMGATTVTIRNTGSTDHVSFDAVGVPGFQFIQDPIEYETRTHHSNQDVFDRAQIDDLKQAAVILAYFVYNTANRDDLLPRKPLAGG